MPTAFNNPHSWGRAAAFEEEIFSFYNDGCDESETPNTTAFDINDLIERIRNKNADAADLFEDLVEDHEDEIREHLAELGIESILAIVEYLEENGFDPEGECVTGVFLLDKIGSRPNTVAA